MAATNGNGKLAITLARCPLLLQNLFIQLSARECIYNIQLKDILYCDSDNSLTIFHLAGGGTILVSKPLIHFEKRLAAHCFKRIHNKYLVNLACVAACCSDEEGFSVKLINEKKLPVSRKNKKGLMEALTAISVPEIENIISL